MALTLPSANTGFHIEKGTERCGTGAQRESLTVPVSFSQPVALPQEQRWFWENTGSPQGNGVRTVCIVPQARLYHWPRRCKWDRDQPEESHWLQEGEKLSKKNRQQSLMSFWRIICMYSKASARSHHGEQTAPPHTAAHGRNHQRHRGTEAAETPRPVQAGIQRSQEQSKGTRRTSFNFINKVSP